jgi:hypothetical protein
MEEKKEDLGLKIGSKEEKWWTNIKYRCEESILNSEQMLVADKEMLKLAEKMIEKHKLK